MKAFQYLIFLLLFSQLMTVTVWAKDNDSNELIIELIEMRNTIYNQEYNNYSKIIDYSINIFNQKPNSAEAFNTVILLDKLELNDIIIKKYKDLKDKYFSSLDDLNSNIPEKLIILFLMFEE